MSTKPLGSPLPKSPRSLPPKPDPKPKPQALRAAAKGTPALSDEESSDDTPATPTTPIAKKLPLRKPPVPIKPVNLKPADSKTSPKPLVRAVRTVPKTNPEQHPTPSPVRRVLSTTASPNIPARSSTIPPRSPIVKPPTNPTRRSTATPTAPASSRPEPKITGEKRASLLKQQLDEQTSRIEALEALLTQAKEACAKLEEEVCQVKSEKDLILQEKAAAWLLKEDELTRASSELQGMLEEKDRQLKELEDQLLDSQFAVAALTEEHLDEINQLKQQMHASKLLSEQQEQKIIELLAAQSEAGARSEELKALKAELQAAREVHQNYMETTERISGQLGHQIADYQQQLFELQGNKSHPTSEEMNALKRRMDQKLQEEMDRTKACQAKAATFERAIIDLRARLDSAPSPSQLKEALDLKDQLEAKLANEAQGILESQDKINELQATIYALEDQLARAPTQEQQKEAAAIRAELEAKLAQEIATKDELLIKIGGLETCIADLQQRQGTASAQHETSELACASLNQQLEATSESLAESQTKAAALEATVLDLQSKLTPAPIQTLEEPSALEKRLREASQLVAEYQRRVASQEQSISLLEAKLSATTSQLEGPRASVAAEERTPAPQAASGAANDSQGRIAQLESEVVAPKEASASPLDDQIPSLHAVDGNPERASSLDAKLKEAEEKLASYRQLESELRDCQARLDATQKENSVARQLIETLKSNPKQPQRYWDAREKELLLTIACLSMELEDQKYPSSARSRQFQATCDAAIAHSQKLARELSEAKHANARKVSTLTAEKKRLLQELQAQQTLNFELMREIEEQQHCQPPEY